MQAESDNGDPVNMEISSETVTGGEACGGAVLEIGSGVKFRGSCE